MEKGIGQRIQKLRKFYNMSRETLSETVGISMSHMGLIERGERGTSIQRYIKISTLFNVSLDYLLAGRGEAHVNNDFNLPGGREILLNEHEIRCMTDFAKTLSLFSLKKEETDLLFDAMHRQLKFMQFVKSMQID